MAVLTAVLVLSACKSLSSANGPGLCMAGSDAASAAFACGAAGLGKPVARARGAEVQSLQASEAQLAPPPATPTALQVQPQALKASPIMTASRNPLVLPPFLRDGADITASIPAKPAEPAVKSALPDRRSVSLHQAVTEAALTHPEIRAAEARVREAKSGIAMSRAAFYPQGDTRLALGGSLGGNAVGRSVYERANPDGNSRVDASISLKQLIYDFGATRADVERATLIKDAEKLKVLDKVDEIVLKTAQAYIKVLESRALLGLVDETVAAHRRLAGIVQANQREGNGTAADVNRVNSRLTDMNAIRSDVSLQLAGAEEQFHRLTRIRPGALNPTPSLAHHLPGSPDAAIAMMKRNNPRLAAMGATARSIEREVDFQRASALPKIQFETDSDTKNYAALNRHKNETEARALVTMRYKFMDGGLSNATVEQLHHRRDGNMHQLRNEDEQTSADIRQAYRAVDSARRKGRLVSEGVTTAAKVQELYLEQFKAGRRTVFELLDSQMSSFTVRRSAIESRFEAERAIFDILRHSGKLAEAMAQAPLKGQPLFTGSVSGASGRDKPAGREARAAKSVQMAKGSKVEPPDANPMTYPVSPARMPKRLPESALAAPPAATVAR
jgi:outer membrane protein, adhesin transport system